MKIYVINLEWSTARWQNISNALNKLGAKYVKVPAIYGKSIAWQTYSDDKYCRDYMGRSIQPGEVGCFLSHIQALKEFVKTGEDFCIILEDDANLNGDIIKFATEIKNLLKSTNFHAINLGPSDYKYTTKLHDFDFHEIHCTHRFPMLATGILWSQAGAAEFLKNFNLVTLPYDNYLRVFFTGKNNTYSIRPSIVIPGNFESDIDSAKISSKRSDLNRSRIYFLIKQKRMYVEKFKALISLIKYRISRNQNV